jgi:hypothetical protein
MEEDGVQTPCVEVTGASITIVVSVSLDICAFAPVLS